MFEWCTQNLRRNGSISRGTSHATTTERYQYTTSVDINNMHYKMIQPLFQNHVRHVHSESAREHRIALYKNLRIIIITVSEVVNNTPPKKKKKKEKGDKV